MTVSVGFSTTFASSKWSFWVPKVSRVADFRIMFSQFGNASLNSSSPYQININM